VKRLLVFGLSGQVGDALLPLLRESEYQVTAVSRQKKSNEQNIVWQQAGFSNYNASEKYFDAIISLGPLDAFSSWLVSSNIKTQKIIALSSTSIVTKENSPDPFERKLAELLHASEQRLVHHAAKAAAKLIVLRPTLIYGNGRDQSLSRWLSMAKRCGFVMLPKNAAGLRQPIHVTDVANALIKAMPVANSEPLILDLPGGETLAFDEMLLRSLQANLPGTVVLRMPDSLFRVILQFATFIGFGRGLGPGFFARLSEDWVFDAMPARIALGYRPRPFSQ
jgi:nucleoside-diphosphate-sugar epimerase